MSLFKKGDRVVIRKDSQFSHERTKLGVMVIEDREPDLDSDGEKWYLMTNDRAFRYCDLDFAPDESDIQVTRSITLTILGNEYILTKAEAKELSEKLIKELS